MASPVSPGTPIESTASITALMEDGSTQAAPLNLPEPMMEPSKSLKFDLLQLESHAQHRSVLRERSQSSNMTITQGEFTEEPSKISAESPDISKPTKKRPELKRGQSSRIMTGLKKTLSSTSLLFQNKLAASGQSSASQSGTTSPMPRTPDFLGLVRDLNTTWPDLESVNEVLEAHRLEAPADNAPVFDELTTLAATLKAARLDSKKTLTKAMKERDNGNCEICRALCIDIVQRMIAGVDTKVYAYNILSTMASPGQAFNYLAEAWTLVKQHEAEHPEYIRLLGVIAMLKEGAVARDGHRNPSTSGRGVPDFADEAVLAELARKPSIPRELQAPVSVRELLRVPMPKENVPCGTQGAVTPKTEKTFKWAGLKK